MSAPETEPPADVAELTRRLAEAERRAAAAEARVTELTAALAAAQAPPAPVVPPVAAPAPVAAQVAAASTEHVEPAPATEPPAAAAPPADGELTELQKTIIEQRKKMTKRGFRREDLYYHQCPSCQEHAVEKWGLFGRPGGRDIDLCLACGSSWSWRRRPDYEKREADTTFDLATFLR